MDMFMFVVGGVLVAEVAALEDCEMNSDDHDAPLLRLVATLHAGTTLADRVRKCRWKRTREAVEDETANETSKEKDET